VTLVRAVGRSALLIGVATLLTTCTDSNVSGPAVPVSAAFDLTGLVRAGRNIPIPVDSLRVRLRRGDNTYAYDQAVWVNADQVRSTQDTFAITLQIDLREISETFDFYVGAEGGGTTYYEVNGTITVSAGQSSRTPDLVPVYVGPGAQADSVTMTLSQPTVVGGDSVLAMAQVWQGNAVVPGVPVGFRSSDTLKLNQVAAVGIDGAWIHPPLTATDSVDIIAETPTGLSDQSRLSFAPPAGQLVLTSGNNQTVAAGTQAGAPLVVQVQDAAGNPYTLGYQVDFAVVSGPAGTSVAPLTAVTDNQGFAQTVLTAGGSAGAVQVSASGTNLSGSPVQFAATVTGGGGPGPADTIVIISGDNQTAPNGTALTNPLVVEVRDQAGVPVPGVTVSWSAVQGSAAPSSSITDGAGRAQTVWTLGTNQTAQSLTASALTLTPAVFNATATFASPSVLMSFVGIPGVGIGLSTTIQVALTSPAGPGGVVVTVSSDAPGTVSIGGGGTVSIPQSQSSGTIQINGLSIGTTTVRGNAPGFIEGTLSVDVQNRNIAVPPTLNVPYGQTASLPIQLPAPAPAGGVTFTVGTSDATRVDVLTPSVTIAAGGQTANATLSGVLPGPATISVTNPSYITGTSAVTTAASLNIVQTGAILNASFGVQLDIDFTSNGQGIAAPAPGVALTGVIADPTCVATSPVTIPTGLVSTPMVLTYAGTATLPCTTQFKVTAPNIQPDSINVTVNPQPGISVNGVTVASGLQVGASGNLGASNHGGVTVTLTSGNPNLLLAPNATTLGTTTLNVVVPNGQSFFNYVVQGVEGQTGTTPVTVTATATGFSNGNGSFDLVQGAIDLIGVPSTTTTLSPISSIYARTGIPNSQTTPAFLVQLQAVRAGAPGPLTVTFANTDPGNASILVRSGPVSADTLTALIPVQGFNSPTDTSSGGVALQPQAAGTSTIGASVPGFLSVNSAIGSGVTISQPGISVNGVTVASGLQVGASGNLGASNHGGVTVTLTSGNANLLLAPNSSTVGSSTLNIVVPNGQTFFNYVVQALEGQTGTTPVTVTATATGFSNGNGSFDLVQGAIDLIGVPGTTTTLSPISSIYVRTGLPNSQTTPAFLVQLQAVRAGAPGPLTATFANTDPGNASILVQSGPVSADTLTALIPVQGFNSPTDTSSGGVALQPQAAGTSTIGASVPGFLQVTSAVGSSVTISQPAVTVNGVTVASGLQVGASGNLGASNHGGVTVTLTSGNANLLLAPNATTVGSSTLNIVVPNGQTFFSYVVQGLEGQTGTTPVTVSATAPGFSNGSGSFDLVQGAIDLIGVPSTTTTLSPSSSIYARTGLPNSQTTPAFLVQLQAVRAGAPGPLTVTFNSQTAAVGDLVKAGPTFSGTQTAQIAVQGFNSPTDTTQGGVALHPVLAGTTVVSATIPGFLQVTSAVGSSVTISQPAITVSGAAVGSGLQVGASGNLGAPNHGGTTVTLTSSNAALLLSPNATTPGTSSINIFVPNGSTFFSFVIQGLEGQTDTVTAAITAVGSGFTNGNGTADVIPAAFDVIGLPATIGAGASDAEFYVRVGIANNTGAFLVQLQAVRAGAPGALTVNIGSNAAGIATLVTTGGGVGPNQQVQVPVQAFNSPTTVSTGGVGLRPVAPGNATITTTIPGFNGTNSSIFITTVQ
jgi:hypothetical protein